ncbi:MAG: T9SS type A sorting domain-containing protein, partial [Bacteroidales bacterium]|nr:T9SS type A sorting domain-containing protein [Bacteroidales bacterium]
GYDYMNCFVVGRMDFEGNLLWRRYWNRYLPEYNMKIYYPQDAAITHDNGCVVTGFSFNSDITSAGNYTYEPDVFLLKFFADGTLSVPQEEIGVRPYAFWPNPAGDWLKLEYSPDVKPDCVEIFDLQGKKVVSQRSNMESIRTAELPSGVYSIRVTLEGGQSYTDKIVKQ